MKGFVGTNFYVVVFLWNFFSLLFALFLAVPLNVGKLRWIKTSRVFYYHPKKTLCV